jgi:hypothetical protein
MLEFNFFKQKGGGSFFFPLIFGKVIAYMLSFQKKRDDKLLKLSLINESLK